MSSKRSTCRAASQEDGASDALLGRQSRSHDDRRHRRRQLRGRGERGPLRRSSPSGSGSSPRQERRAWMPRLSVLDDGAGHRVELVSLNWSILARDLGHRDPTVRRTRHSSITSSPRARWAITGSRASPPRSSCSTTSDSSSAPRCNTTCRCCAMSWGRHSRTYRSRRSTTHTPTPTAPSFPSHQRRHHHEGWEQTS